jgi:tetratricopeptide (TPR) repeat protein
MGRKFAALLFSLALLCSVAARGEDDSAARHAVASAIQSGEYDQALSLLAPLLKAHAQDPSLWTLQGLAFDRLGRMDESLTSFDHALSIDKTYAPALEGASQEAYLHDDARASGYVHRLLVVMPENAVANAMAATLAYQANDCPATVRYFQRSGEAVYRNEHALSEFADCLVRSEQYGNAVEILQRGLQSHPESVELKYNLAVALLHNHQTNDAIAVLEPLASEKDSGLLNLLASAYTQANRPDDAFRTLEQAIIVSPTDQSNYLDLAILCLEHHQENRSVAAASAGIARIPDASSLFLIRGVAYAQLANYDKAENDFSTAARLQPNQPHSTIAMSLLYSDQNQFNKEKALLEAQLKRTPQDAVTNYLLADLLIRQGAVAGQPEFEEARAALATSLKAKPDSAEAQILMGKVCEQEHDFSAALNHYQMALKAEPDNRSALDREFVLLRKLHRDEEAAKVLEHLKSILNNELEQERATTQVRSVQHGEN